MNATETSFYVTGGTLRSDAPSYVERRAARLVEARAFSRRHARAPCCCDQGHDLRQWRRCHRTVSSVE